MLTAVLAALAGGVTVILVSPARYQGTARVVLDYIRPDPTTGAVVPSKMLDAYISSQISLLQDFQVTGPAVEAMGFLDNPDVQQAYYANPPADGRDLHAWIGAQVGAAVSGTMVEDSNIMEIRYVAASPELAEATVDAIRASFIESAARQTRATAEEQASVLASRIETTRATLTQLQSLKNRMEDETGLVMAESGRDEEAAKLGALMGRIRAPVIYREPGVSEAAYYLRRVDAQIAEASVSLGVNNPQLIALRQKRIALASQVAAEEAAAGSSGQVAAANERAAEAMVEEQKQKVLSVREPTLRLRLIQDQINRQREELNGLTEKLVAARTLAGADTSTTTPIGPASAKRTPVFPNKLLILGGSGGLGLVLGGLIALLAEVTTRRVRAVRDLEALTGAPVLGAIPDFQPKRRRRKRRATSSTTAPALDDLARTPPMAAE